MPKPIRRSEAAIRSSGIASVFLRLGCSGRFQHRPQHLPDILGDNLVAACRRMNHVRQVQLRLTTDAFEKERHERGVVAGPDSVLS